MRLLFGLLFFSVTASGQDHFSRDSSVVKTIEGLPASEPFDTAHSYRRATHPYVYIISDKDLYDLFGYETAVKFYQFNFTDYHILGKQVCRQCQLYCRHEDGNTKCHRNRCNESWTWLMRDNKKAFAEIPSTRSTDHVNAIHPSGQDNFFHDTIQRSKTDSTLARWYTSGHGDCFASFDYKVVKDNFYPVVLLKEWNYWGGCRAGGSWEFTISFRMPDSIAQFSKNTILADRKMVW